MAPNKAPSAGAKVNLGSKAPVTHESTGTVDPSSLAAESRRHGGAFSENPTSSGSSPGQPASQSEYQSSLSGAAKPSTSTGISSNSASLESAQMSKSSHSERGQRGMPSKSTKTEESKMVSSPEGQGGKAPSYVENLVHGSAERGGKPHGKNLTEGGFEGSGTAEGALPEPGSEDDPGRAAFRKLAGSAAAGSGMAKGVKESEGRKGFAQLGSEESA
ncbi:hypothetical protein QBC41DRAFT_151215 [Cercophora samala]|uniref:Uncharacterized protein n=1 Tax=Cercophora samala TaxID=330535 RepID=A0AA39Z8Z7_9PEZI|nr:hypothetical protein QBC41DRAFT_151215 [Cercophora samala]